MAAAATAATISTATVVTSATTSDDTKTVVATTAAATTTVATVKSDATKTVPVAMAAVTTTAAMSAATAMKVMAGTDMPAARIGIATAPVELLAAPQVVTNVSDTTAKATATPPELETQLPALELPGTASLPLVPRRVTPTEVRATTECCLLCIR